MNDSPELREPVQLSQIRRWEAGELYPDHDTFAFGHGFGTALVEAFDALRAVALAARDHSRREPPYCNIFCAAVGDTSHCDLEGRCLDFHSEEEKRAAFAKIDWANPWEQFTSSNREQS